MSHTSELMQTYERGKREFIDKFLQAGINADEESVHRLFDELVVSFDLGYATAHGDRIAADVKAEMRRPNSNATKYVHFLADDLEEKRSADQEALQPVYKDDDQYSELVDYIRTALPEKGRRWVDIVEPGERFSDIVEPDLALVSDSGSHRAM